jgi:hypothetical protein
VTDPTAKIWDLTFQFSQKGQQLLARIDPDGLVVDIPGVTDRRKIEQREKEQREQVRVQAALEHQREQLKVLNERLDRIREEAVQQRDQLAKEIRAMDDAAPKLNGEAVYRTRDHQRAFTAGERELTREEYDSIHWDALKSENHIEDRRERREHLREVVKRIDTVDKVQVRANADDTSLEEIKKMRTEAARLEADAAGPKDQIASATGPSRSGLTGPDLNGSFVGARDNAATHKINPRPTSSVPIPSTEL